MMMDNFSIVFMGTPEFASHSLKKIHQDGIHISCVITAADKPAGRGRKIKMSAVKNYALANKLPVLQPPNLKDPEFIGKLKKIDADLFVVVAFRMLPEIVWDMPRCGTINLHASLLPDYRGAAPINHALINGEKTTGVTTFYIEKEIDTGKIILQDEVDIDKTMNAGMLHDLLMRKGGDLLLKTIKLIDMGKDVPTIIQLSESSRKAPKLFPKDCKIPWNDTLENIYNHIRGLSPYPGAWSEAKGANGKAFQFKIFSAEAEKYSHKHSKPSIHTDGKNFLKISVPEGFIIIKELQLPGKKRMAVAEFLKGYRDLDWIVY
ncbi:MAG: methionyl-tRNA formyltransferase [Bacteroidota bacterium]|nr:methionyl-tRNA formyltransferase [Bacteroidota bacterium]